MFVGILEINVKWQKPILWIPMKNFLKTSAILRFERNLNDAPAWAMAGLSSECANLVTFNTTDILCFVYSKFWSEKLCLRIVKTRLQSLNFIFCSKILNEHKCQSYPKPTKIDTFGQNTGLGHIPIN